MIRIMGLALFLAGWALRRWALRELAKVGISSLLQLAIPAVPQRYTTSGPYRFLRHPCYLGSYLILAGVGLMVFGSLAGAALFVPAWPHYYQRILLEEERRSIEEFHRCPRHGPGESREACAGGTP
jgi:protein-S-isoprenylcysteine O-methyltransferase Ste14